MDYPPALSDNQHLSSDQINKVIADFNKVAGAYRTDIEHKLENCTATYKDAMEWYYSIDPVSEKLYLDILTSELLKDDGLALRTMKQVTHKPLLLISAGQISICHLSGINHEFNRSDLTNKDGLEYFRFLASKIEVPDTEEKLNKLITTAHLYMEAVDLLGGNRQIGEGSVPDEINVDEKIASQTAMILLDKSLKACKSAVDRGDDGFLDLAITTYMERSSHFFALAALSTGLERIACQKEAFNCILSAIRTYFIDGSNCVLNSQNDKGPLHEILWMLDTSFLFATSNNFLQDAYVSPSLQRMDKPLIDKPKFNRGIDMSVSLKTNNAHGMRDNHNIQLKSRNSRLGKYHPSILVIGEENFDVQVNNLFEKINMYKMWVDSDFNQELEDKIKHLVLKSSQDIVSYLENDRPITLKERITKRLGSVMLYAFGFSEPVLDYLLEKNNSQVDV